MEKYKIIIEEPAMQDLRDIFTYIADTLMEPQTAKQLIRRIRNAIEGLERMPERFPLYDSEPWHSRGIRRLNIDNFAAFYIVVKENFTVSILTVIYSGRDVDKFLIDKSGK